MVHDAPIFDFHLFAVFDDLLLIEKRMEFLPREPATGNGPGMIRSCRFVNFFGTTHVSPYGLGFRLPMRCRYIGAAPHGGSPHLRKISCWSQDNASSPDVKERSCTALAADALSDHGGQIADPVVRRRKGS